MNEAQKQHSVLFAEYDEFNKVLYPALSLGEFKRFKSSEEIAEYERKPVDEHLSKIKATAFFKRVCHNENYTSATSALATRFKQKKDVRYATPLSEIALLRCFAMYFHFYEIAEHYPLAETFPSKQKLKEMRKATETAMKLLRQFSGVSSKIAAYPLAENMENTVRRIQAIERTYRKPRVDADVRKMVFAESVAVELKRAFGECSYVVLSSVCALVDYNVAKTTLINIANSAIKESETLAGLDSGTHIAPKHN